MSEHPLSGLLESKPERPDLAEHIAPRVMWLAVMSA